MNCHETREDLALLAGGDLGWWRRTRARRHLGRCDACRAELAALTGARAVVCEALEQSGAIEPDDGAWEQIRGRIAGLEVVRPVSPRPAHRFARAARLAAPAIGLAALLLLLLSDGGDEDGSLLAPVTAVASSRPVIEYTAGPGTTVMTFETDDPHVAICWFFSGESTDE